MAGRGAPHERNRRQEHADTRHGRARSGERRFAGGDRGHRQRTLPTKFWDKRDTYEPIAAGSIDGSATEPHDHAIKRAMNAIYEPPSHAAMTESASRTLFVGHLAERTTGENLKGHFERYGPVMKAVVVTDTVTGASRCYGFVEFKHSKDASDAFQHAHRAVLDHAELLVDYERERTMPGWIPRRLGGGLGGKKESGQLRFGGRARPHRERVTSFRENRRLRGIPPAQPERRERHRAWRRHGDRRPREYHHRDEQHH